MRIMVVDIGGTHVKLLATGRRTPVRLPSGPQLTPNEMVKLVKAAAAGWQYEVVSIGVPAPVVHGRAVSEPHNLGPGWVGFNFQKGFGKPVKVVNDAAMQALGSYQGGRLLFLGLGTGLGSALIIDGNPSGNTPTELFLAEGQHTIAVRQEGFEAQETSLVLRSGETRELDVQLTKSAPVYTRWWFWTGVSRSRLDQLHPLTERGVDLGRVRKLAGVPHFILTAAACDAGGWLAALTSLDKTDRLRHEMMLCYFAGYVQGTRASLASTAADTVATPIAP